MKYINIIWNKFLHNIQIFSIYDYDTLYTLPSIMKPFVMSLPFLYHDTLGNECA